jgi:Flp pilus assembly protein TadG
MHRFRRSRRAPLARRGIGSARRRNGQSLVEFAVVLPVFLLVLAGIIDFGLGLYSQMTIINASREGARFGVVEPGNVTGIEDRVQAMAGGLDVDTTVTCQRPTGPSTFGSCAGGPGPWQSGDAVVVKVEYDYHLIWPLAFGNTLGLSSTVQMRIE